jgi:hypothetical protein
MDLKYSNRKKPDNKKWKKVADYFLYTGLPTISVALVALQPVNPEFSLWAVAGINVAIVVFKGLTKFTTDEEPTTK